jgi:flagella basal body P-ring formation protein FlgA
MVLNFKLVAACVAAWACAAACAAAGAAELRLRAQCTPVGPVVTLGDVAEVLAADEQEARRVAAVELFPLQTGGARFVRLRELQDLLLLRGVDLSAHRISGASVISIQGGGPARAEVEPAPTAAAVRRASSRVQEAIVQFLRERVAADEPWAVEVALTPAQARAVAAGGKLSATGGAPPWTGPQRFEITATGGEAPARTTVEAHVALPPAVVVATRPLGRGAAIRETDVELQRGATADDAAEAFQSLDEVIGRETTRALSPGKVIGRDAVRAPLLVRRGDVVTVFARSPGIQVRTTARAKDEGGQGDLVAVESLHDRSAFYAQVSGPREVEVFARGPRVEAHAPAAAAPSAATRSATPAQTNIRLLSTSASGSSTNEGNRHVRTAN